MQIATISQTTPHNGLVEPNTTMTFTACAQDSNTRIDTFLSDNLSFYSRSFFALLIENGRVAINGVTIAKPSTRLKHNDTVAVTFPPRPTLDSSAIHESAHGVKLIFQHEHFLILYKPAGLVIHPPTSTFTSPTLTDWLKLTFKELESVGFVDRPGIVHRLDKDTSGLLVVARTNYAHSTFGAMFKERTMHKTYLALVHGHPNPSGSIDLAIGRDRTHRTKMATNHSQNVTIAATMRDALTHYKVVRYFAEHALVEVKPVTGRTHQIRVHCTAIGHPLVGDASYGPRKTTLIDRQALHAYSLAFTFDGQEYTFTQELPDDFMTAIKRAGPEIELDGLGKKSDESETKI